MTKQNLQIRLANIDDAYIIANFNVKMAKETENKTLSLDIVLDATKKVINSNKIGFYLIAYLNNIAVASLLITYEWSDWRNGFFWWIQSVYVLPEYRNKGIFKELYNYVKELAKINKDVCGLRLYVDKDNSVAQKVYQKLGMKETNYLMMEEEF